MAVPIAAKAGYLAWQNRRSLAALLALLLGLPIAVALMLVVIVTGANVTTAGGGPGTFEPSAAALADIPAPYLAAYQAAGAREGIGWEYIAAIGKVETNHGRSTLPGVHSGTNSAGAAGPMQFLAATFAASAVDGNHDGTKDVYDFEDAIPAAAKYLKAAGAPADWPAAIFAYNHADWYVNEVEQQAAKYRGAPVAGAAGSGDGSAQAIADAATQLDAMRVPYNYGGGHVDPAAPTPGLDGTFPGLDCSSSVSWVLQHAGIQVSTMTSGAFMSWGDPGPGERVTIYTNPTHIIMSIQLDDTSAPRFFGTSGFGHPRAGTGPAWFTEPVSASYLAGFVQRHPPGL